jgi:hypothetical protein
LWRSVAILGLSLLSKPNNTNNNHLFNYYATMEQPTYYGIDCPAKLLEVKGLRIDPDHREGEASLMKRRWFDYRHMHPAAATYLYAEIYRQQTIAFYESCVDIRTVENARAFVPDDIFMSRDLTSMWLARRCADHHGLPYPFVVQFAQKRFFSRTQHNFPRPNQLYGEEFEIDLLAAWKELTARQITYSTSPQYRMSAWRGEIAQAQHVRFVIDQIKARPAPRYRLLARMLSEDVLSSALIASNFSQQEASQAETYCAQFM